MKNSILAIAFLVSVLSYGQTNISANNIKATGNISATGTVTGSNIPGSIPGAGTCVNQFVRVLNNGLPPTCATVGSSDLASSLALITPSIDVATGVSLNLNNGLIAKTIDNIQFAAQYAGSSNTCGVQEAYNALPSSGGKIILQQGNCSASGWPVTIQKPVVIEGQGMGGPTDAGTNANISAGTSLSNTSTGNSFFVISLGAATSVEGTTLRDFAMIGNKSVGGATAGDCVDINGGAPTTQVRAISFQNIQCNQPKGSGWVVQDNVFMINFLNVHVDQSGSHCFVFKNGPSAAGSSQIHFLQSTADLCGGSNASFAPGTADGFNFSGAGSRGVDFIASTAADSANGINVVAGATGVQLHITNSDFETNATCDISLNDGYGHMIVGSTLLGTGVGARGICTSMPGGAPFSLVQLIAIGNNISSHTVQDITVGATQHTCFIGVQAVQGYTFSDASLTCVVENVNSNGALLFTGLGGLIPSASAGASLGSSTLPWNNNFLFGFQSWNESTAPAALTGTDRCYGDSTAHAIECSYNNSTFGIVPLVNLAQTWTAIQTYTAAIAPSQTAGIVGTTTNNSANAGSVGEVISSTIATGSSVSLTTATTANITSVSLTAGDWDCTGAVDYTFGATTSYTNLVGSISTTSATLGAQDSKFDFETPAAVPTASSDATFVLPVVRELLSGTTTVFLVAQGTFTLSTLKAYGTIRCRRSDNI